MAQNGDFLGFDAKPDISTSQTITISIRERGFGGSSPSQIQSRLRSYSIEVHNIGYY
jgi:hypothetical protein